LIRDTAAAGEYLMAAFRLIGWAAVLLTWTTAARAQHAASLVSASAFANFNTSGVVVTISGNANGNAALALEWRAAGGAFRPAYPPQRIDATRFVGSLFGLDPRKGGRKKPRERAEDGQGDGLDRPGRKAHPRLTKPPPSAARCTAMALPPRIPTGLRC
jgi:hypothetical protein